MRSPEKCGYSVGKLCPTAKLWMIAVFGPKSLYSGLAICSLLPFELKEANIIHDTRTTYPAMSSQSARLEPLGRGRDKFAASVRLPPSLPLKTRCFHLGQVSTATAVAKNKRLPHRSGRDAHANASPARYVNHELTNSPTRIAAAHRCAADTNGKKRRKRKSPRQTANPK